MAPQIDIKQHKIIMYKLFTILLVISAPVLSQNAPIDFEPGGFGENWTWTVFENDTNPPLEIIANPDPSGINTSATVAKFTALQSGMPFAGVESMHGSDIGTFNLTPENAIVRIKVWKSTISDVGIKYATPEGASTGEIKVPNTVTEQWEELTFDFSGVINEPSSTGIDQIIIFPDFTARTSDNIIFWDDIQYGEILGQNTYNMNNAISYPNPVSGHWNVQYEKPIESLTLYNIMGKELFKDIPNSTHYTLNTSNLPFGVYLVNISSEDGSRVMKFIKK